MKKDSLIYGVGTMLVIVSAIVQILHLPGEEIAGLIYKIAFLGMFFFMSLQHVKLKKRIKELEGSPDSQQPV